MFYRANQRIYPVQQNWEQGHSEFPAHSILQLAERCPDEITARGIRHFSRMHTQVVAFIGRWASQEDLYKAEVLYPGDTNLTRVSYPTADPTQRQRWVPEGQILETLQRQFPQGYIRVECRDELLSLCEARL